jgi:PilZ domain
MVGSFPPAKEARIAMRNPYRAGLGAMQRGGPDRRRAPRFRVELRVEWEHGTGITRDLSVGGVFFVTPQVVAPGDPLECTLVFEHLDPDHPVRLSCRGQVVRVEPDDRNTGVAVAITAYRGATPE